MSSQKNPEEYTLIYESEMEDPEGFEDYYEIDPETVDPWKVTRAVNLGVSSRKEFYAGHLFNGELVSALFVDPMYTTCFSFDVAVLPEHQAKGLGAELVDEAINVFDLYEDSLLDSPIFEEGDFEYCVHVVNPYMKSLLERKGFQVIESASSDNEWIMNRIRRNPQNLPIYVNNLGVHTNAPIPLYHATTAADAIIEEGFKTPDELPRGSFGLGSSGMGLISMTGDPRYAEAICVHMATHARIGIGDLRWSELMADFRRVSPKRYQAIVDGTDLKARNLIHVLKVMDKGQVPVNRGMFGEDMSLSLNPERYELVSMEEYVEYRREYCVSKNLEHLIDAWTNPAKNTLADLYNELLWINDGTIENPVGDSDLWTRFLGKDLSILDQIAYVRADLNPDMRIVSRNSSVDMPSVFYSRSGEFSVDEYGVQKLKRGEDLYTRGSYRAPTPLPESETGLTFDVDPEFVDRVPAEDYNKFAIYLRAEDEFRLPAPRDQLTPAVLEGTAMDILEVLPDLWQGKDVTCFYPRIGEKRKTLRDNL